MSASPAPPSGTVDDNRENTTFRDSIGALLFASRWLQAPLYLGLIGAQLLYVFTFMRELWHLTKNITTLSEAEMMLMVLGLVDVVMVANLLIMVTIGGYETFVSKLSVNGHRDQPEWLSHVNANVLKVKLAMAIIGISSVHLLKSFVEAKSYFMDPALDGKAGEILLWQTIIHIAFILSAMALAWIDKIGTQHVGGHRAQDAQRLEADAEEAAKKKENDAAASPLQEAIEGSAQLKELDPAAR